MDSLSVGIPSPPSIATGERWSQVNTDLRNDLRSRRPSLPPGGGRDQIGRVAAIRSVGWPPSGWNTWPPWIGIHRGPSTHDKHRRQAGVDVVLVGVDARALGNGR